MTDQSLSTTHINNNINNDLQDNSLNNHNEVINNEQFEEMRDLLEEDFADLVQSFISDSQQRIALMQNAQAANDNANGFEAAHALKGASLNLGATQLSSLSGQLQEACRAGQISQQAPLIEQLAAALQLVETQINRRLGHS